MCVKLIKIIVINLYYICFKQQCALYQFFKKKKPKKKNPNKVIENWNFLIGHNLGFISQSINSIQFIVEINRTPPKRRQMELYHFVQCISKTCIYFWIISIKNDCLSTITGRKVIDRERHSWVGNQNVFYCTMTLKCIRDTLTSYKYVNFYFF